MPERGLAEALATFKPHDVSRGPYYFQFSIGELTPGLKHELEFVFDEHLKSRGLGSAKDHLNFKYHKTMVQLTGNTRIGNALLERLAGHYGPNGYITPFAERDREERYKRRKGPSEVPQ